MSKVLGFDTSNYTTSVAVVENNTVIYEKRKILDVELGKRGLRQSEALFQHIKNIPNLLDEKFLNNIDAVCVSTRPRPYEDSYMPVFKAGESIAKSIAKTLNIPLFETTHQEGHIEAAKFSIGFNEDEFIAIHLSGGTSEVLLCRGKDELEINLIGGTRDISMGQFLDRIGVALGYSFPSGKFVDELALNTEKTDIIIPSKVDGLFFNLSGQETRALNYINDGCDKNQIALASMKCLIKTLDKLFNNIFSKYNKKILLFGGVASSRYIKNHINLNYNGRVYIADASYASDNAIGVALIGYRRLNNRRDYHE